MLEREGETPRPSLLVVDDERPLLEIFVEFFEESAYELTIANSGEEAVELLNTRSFDLVVTDLNLPGIDGLSVMSHAKAVDPDIEIIVLTGNASTLTAIDALRQGAYDYVLKPFDLYEMDQTVAKGLERRQLRTQNRRYVESLQRHRDELKRRVEEATWRIRALYEVGKEITSTLNLDRALGVILEKSTELTHARRGLIFLREENSGPLECGVALGLDEEPEAKAQLKAALQSSNEKAMRELTPVIERVQDLSGEQHMALVVPLIQEDEVTGTIVVLAPESGTFSDDDQQLLVSLASQASIAIHNARVYGKIQTLDRMKSEFVAVVSHEVRTPLTAIKGTLEILSDPSYFEVGEPQMELMHICQANVERLEALINDILDFSKLESSRLSTHFVESHLGSLVETVVVNLGTLAEKKSLRLETDIAPDLPIVEADELRISQVIGNLVSNAAKFSNEGGTIRLIVRPEGDGVVVCIEDAGIGIAPDDIPKLFAKFRQLDASSTRKVGGTGLGLAICRGIVEEHHGRIWVESTLGKGSRFSFWIPMRRSVARPDVPAATTTRAA